MKIKLIESKRITEAFSPSMPRWLREKLLRDKTAWESGGEFKSDPFHYSSSFAGAKKVASLTHDNYITKGYALDKFVNPHYSARGNFTNLYGLLLNCHFDLSSATFITPDSLPKNGKDPMVTEPNIPIWLVKAKGQNPDKYQVYMKGFNDDELWGDKQQKFAYASVKQLNAACEGFCYVDGGALNTYNRDKYNARQEFNAQNIPGEPDSYYRYYQGNIPNKYRRYAGTQRQVWHAIDKSGYAQVPAVEKYADKLRDLKVNNAANWLENCYHTIMQYKNDFADYIYNLDAQDAEEIDVRQIRHLMEIYNECVRRYTIMCNLVDYATNKETLADAFGPDGTATWLDINIKQLQRKTAQWRTVIADWD